MSNRPNFFEVLDFYQNDSGYHFTVRVNYSVYQDSKVKTLILTSSCKNLESPRSLYPGLYNSVDPGRLINVLRYQQGLWNKPDKA
jgi:hypothetical protein